MKFLKFIQYFQYQKIFFNIKRFFSISKYIRILRDITLPSNNSKPWEPFQEAIAKRVLSFSKNGFINYFGMQRFGTTFVPTHEIGKFIIMKMNKRIKQN